MSRRVGAPSGFCMHWLNYELSVEFKKNYRVTYNKRFHNYRYARYLKRTFIDEFLVVRTSKRCYRVIYYNDNYKHFQYFSAENYRECAEKMQEIFELIKSLEDCNK